jgi:hypothetical protein
MVEIEAFLVEELEDKFNGNFECEEVCNFPLHYEVCYELWLSNSLVVLLASVVALVVDVYYDIPASMSKCLLTF